MAGDGAGVEEGVTSLVVRAVLGEKKNGVFLHRQLQAVALPYLVELTEGETQEEVESELPNNPKSWVEAFEDAWKHAASNTLPKLLASRAEIWSGMVGSPPTPPSAPGQASSTATYGAGAGGMGSSGITGKHIDDSQMQEMLGGLEVSDHDFNKAIQDIQAQRISGARIMALSLALVSGEVHPAGDSVALRYGSDLRLCEIIRKQRKAGVSSLDDVLKTKNRREIALHFTRLAKNYNDRKLIEEATLVSQFWAETTSAFEGDDANLVVYLMEWARKYSGRGIPKVLDTDLILRFRKQGGGSTSDDVKKIEDAVKKAEKELSKSEERNAAMMKRMQRLEEAVKRSQDGGTAGGGCWHCGAFDHQARDCPHKPGKGKGKGGRGGGAGKAEIIDVTGDAE